MLMDSEARCRNAAQRCQSLPGHKSNGRRVYPMSCTSTPTSPTIRIEYGHCRQPGRFGRDFCPAAKNNSCHHGQNYTATAIFNCSDENAPTPTPLLLSLLAGGVSLLAGGASSRVDGVHKAKHRHRDRCWTVGGWLLVAVDGAGGDADQDMWIS